MVLRKSFHKLQSSLAHLVFANRELLIMRDHFDWSFLTRLPAAIVRDEREYLQMFASVRLSVLTNHIEIMRQALKEHIDFLNNVQVEKSLNGIGFFLFDLRNALSHTKNILIPKWSETPKTSGTFCCTVPVAQDEGKIRFDPKGYVSMGFVMKVTPGRTIRVTSDLIDSIVLLSYHVLELVKKQKPRTLDRYLKSIPAPSIPMPTNR